MANKPFDDTWAWFRCDNILDLPNTTTQDAMEAGCKKEKKRTFINRKAVSFGSHATDPLRFEASGHLEKPPAADYKSTYTRHFGNILPIRCKPVNRLETVILDPLWNRKPKNDFDLVPRGNNKFWDDHFYQLTPGRKKINMFRQLRNASFEFGYDE